jgi:cytoskeletal protein CcmA (bactofilin family)
MAENTSNTPQRLWNTSSVGPVVEHATIGTSIMIKGEVTGNEALFIEGTVDGTIRIPDHRVTVGKDSHVTANITAREVVVMGAVKGDIHCTDLLDIRAESNIQGEIVTRRIRIDDGAMLRGSVEIQQPEKKAIESAAVGSKPASPGEPGAKKIDEAHVEPAKQGVKDAEPAVTGSEVAKEEVLTSAIARRMGATAGGWFKSGR